MFTSKRQTHFYKKYKFYKLNSDSSMGLREANMTNRNDTYAHAYTDQKLPIE